MNILFIGYLIYFSNESLTNTNNINTEKSIENIKNKYNLLCKTSSDINEHLPVLYNYATECESIIECGVRGCISSWAFVYGLLNNNKNKKILLLNDIDKCDIKELLDETKNIPIDLSYQWISDLDLKLSSNYDMVFIDTWHIYGQLKRELDKFGPITNKYIIMHDTTIDEINGETIRCHLNAKNQSIISGYPIEEINEGLGKAITEFLNNNNDWIVHEKLTNNNGLTILKKI